ncbi:xylulokinase [Allonocardiopsis opalescens]|uniref:Xylulose kinase n=1 Tax=Allonocardiopsis opalescens TaxID=1144618 RepID=A0A2T0Q9E0_9ACTN|nr:xylulokinase [Allonocardiopsis opalescens]PRY00509.1 xylulokinase [Allonocardiopsis opalescens]
MLVAGIDSSTQSTKIVLCRADDGGIVGEATAPHPDGTECDPAEWWHALTKAGEHLLERADAVAVAAQQHGMVALDADGEVVRPALLWNDVRSAPQTRALTAELGGPGAWAERTGSVPAVSFTVTKLRWMAEHEPGNAARTAGVLLPHDWLTWRLGGKRERTTDRGDASGTGYWSPATGEWLPEFLTAALGHSADTPRVAAPGEVVGETSWGAKLAPGTGDNMGAALGLGLRTGDVAVSVGTSGTAFAVAEHPTADPTGIVAGFADATGRHLPLVCTLNAARILTYTAGLLGVDVDELSRLTLAAEPGAGGVTLLPYFDGERTPARPEANAVMRGLTGASATRENLARAAVEALACSLADAVDALVEHGVTVNRVLLIGGGARSDAFRRIAPAVFGRPLEVPEPAEYVALGAARQAAWALRGGPTPPEWPSPPALTCTADPTPHVRDRYAELREDTRPWHENREAR